MTRASDEDRERTALALRDHHLAGRLGVEDFETRLAQAYGAADTGELFALTSDLPAPSAPPRTSERPTRRFLPGVTPFQEVTATPVSQYRAYTDALETVVPSMARAGYALAHSEAPNLLRFERRTGGGFLPFLVLGWLALFAARGTDEHVVMTFTPMLGGGTKIIASGEATRAVRKAFAELRA